MTFEDLKKIGEINQVRIDSYENHLESPPYYFDSLRHGLGYYFNTFSTKNYHYDHYSLGLSSDSKQTKTINTFPRAMLDEDNTVLSIVSLQRFFEIQIKQFLSDEDATLIVKNGRPIGFTQALNSFYDLIASNNLTKIGKGYSTLVHPDSKVALQFLTWWRNRIIHNGSYLPSMWLLDYSFTQLWMPIIAEITCEQSNTLGDSLFYLKTLTGINIIDELLKIKFSFADLSDPTKKEETFTNLLLIGQLKELGRCNLNMNLFVRNNQASYEYNYRDAKGRGMRFANAETTHPHFSKILKCPCCSVESLVLYSESVLNIFSKKNENMVIEWVKCYTCDYHLRFNVGDLSHFGFTTERLFHFKQ